MFNTYGDPRLTGQPISFEQQQMKCPFCKEPAVLGKHALCGCSQPHRGWLTAYERRHSIKRRRATSNLATMHPEVVRQYIGCGPTHFKACTQRKDKELPHIWLACTRGRCIASSQWPTLCNCTWDIAAIWTTNATNGGRRLQFLGLE